MVNKGPVRQYLDIFFDARLNKRFNKQRSCQWFETSWCLYDVTVIGCHVRASPRIIELKATRNHHKKTELHVSDLSPDIFIFKVAKWPSLTRKVVFNCPKWSPCMLICRINCSFLGPRNLSSVIRRYQGSFCHVDVVPHTKGQSCVFIPWRHHDSSLVPLHKAFGNDVTLSVQQMCTFKTNHRA